MKPQKRAFKAEPEVHCHEFVCKLVSFTCHLEPSHCLVAGVDQEETQEEVSRPKGMHLAWHIHEQNF